MNVRRYTTTSPLLAGRPFATLTLVLFGLVSVACESQGTAGSAPPREIARDTACALDGMLLADYPGPKAQIHYVGRDAPDFFCDTVEMFNVYLEPEQARTVRSIYVQDMEQAEWDAPRAHWIDAREAYFVVGSKRHGSMGPTIASFAREDAARTFASEYGGQVLPFAAVSADKAVIDGGALHDSPM